MRLTDGCDALGAERANTRRCLCRLVNWAKMGRGRFVEYCDALGFLDRGLTLGDALKEGPL